MERFRGMIPVATVSQPMEAIPIQLRLSSFGIDSQLDGELIVSVNPLLSNAIGGIHVLVSTEDAQQATEILNECRQKEADAMALRDRTCPKCGDTNGIRVKRPLIVAIIAVATLGVFSFLYPWPRYKCPNCRHKWQ